MAVTDFSTHTTIGVNFNRRTAEPEFQLGLTMRGTNNTAWIYGQSSGAVATGTCTVNMTTFAITDTAGEHTADTAFAANEYGWVRETAVDVGPPSA